MTRDVALTSAREVAAYLKKVHGATKVLLFGSSVRGRFLPNHSDIDLYFEGVPYEREGVITGRTFRQFSNLDLDLIPAGHATEELKREILQTGVDL
jgi:predicted nucleotidyltransferase